MSGERIQLGKIYKRKTDTIPIGVYPNYMVLIGKNKVMKEIIRYRFIDMEWGQEPYSVMSDNDIRSYYELVDNGDTGKAADGAGR